MNRQRDRLLSWPSRLLVACTLTGLLVLGSGCGKKSDPAPKGEEGSNTKPMGTGKTPDSLAFVPGNGLGFGVVQMSALWESAPGKEAQKLLTLKPQELDNMTEEIGLKPADIEYVGFLMLVAKEEPLMFVVAKQKLDRAKITERMVPNAKAVTHEGKELFVGSYFSRVGNVIGVPKGNEKSQPQPKQVERQDSPHDPSLYYVNDNTFIKGRFAMVKKFLEHKAAAGTLSPVLAQAGDHHVVGCLDFAAMVKDAGSEPKSVPPDFKPLLKAKEVTFLGDVGQPWKLRLNASFPDDAAAKAGQEAADKALSMVKAQLMLVKGMVPPSMEMFAKPIEQVQEGLKQASVKQNGADVALAVDLPIEVKVDTAALGQVKQAADRTTNMNNIKQIVLGLHNYESVYNKFPPRAICDKDGKPLLSWRVTLLPFVEGDAIYRQLHLNEPWDSEHNKKFHDQMPKLFALPGGKAGPGMTNYRVFTGPNTLFGEKGKVEKMGDIFGLYGDINSLVKVKDGTSNTIFVVEAGEAVPWLKPDDFDLDAKQLPKLGAIKPGQFAVGMLDGSVRVIDLQKTNEKTLRAMISPAGGEVVPID